MSRNHDVSHNACSVQFGCTVYRLPRFSVGDLVLYHGRIWFVNGVYSLAGAVSYSLVSDDGSLPENCYEHDLISASSTSIKKIKSCWGFCVGDTVYDTSLLFKRIYIVDGFDFRRQSVKIRLPNQKWSYLSSPADLIFVNPATLKTSKDRSILNDKENNC